jgi:hypothetical protein
MCGTGTGSVERQPGDADERSAAPGPAKAGQWSTSMTLPNQGLHRP